MADQPNDNAESALLSWRMPSLALVAKKSFSVMMVCLPIVWVLAFGLRIANHVWEVALMGLFAIIFSAVFYSIYSRVVQEFSIVTSVVRVTLFSGREETVGWQDISILREGQSFAASLKAENHRLIWFDVPRDVKGKLVAILREASNAQIVGFD